MRSGLFSTEKPLLDMSGAIVHRRDRRERGEFLFPVTPDSDPGSRISPQMTQIAQIRRPKNGFICVICDICDICGSVFK
jgi:hypothetical protein